jgi:hypothetical protein
MAKHRAPFTSLPNQEEAYRLTSMLECNVSYTGVVCSGVKGVQVEPSSARGFVSACVVACRKPPRITSLISLGTVLRWHACARASHASSAEVLPQTHRLGMSWLFIRIVINTCK